MKILLTGPGGLGAPLLCALDRRGHAGRVVRLREDAPLPVSWETLRLDLSDARNGARLEEACHGCDAVVHLAAVTHTNDLAVYERVNVEGTRHLLDAASRAGVARFVHVSTRAIAAGGGGYSASKARAEALVRASAIPWTIVRPAEAYGAGREGLGDLIARVREGRPVPVIGDGSALLAPVHVDDVVAGLVAAIERKPAGETFLLAGPEQMTYRELVARLGRFYGRAPRTVSLPVPVARLVALALGALMARPPLVRDQIPRLLSAKPYDLAPAQAALQFSPRRLEEGLAAIASA